MAEDRVGGASSLEEVLVAVAGELEEVESRPAVDGTEWSIGGIVFAAIGPEGADFRLSRPVAAAALRTPDTARSPRGPDWVAFRPSLLDRHALDRAEAWFTSAWRRADGET